MKQNHKMEFIGEWMNEFKTKQIVIVIRLIILDNFLKMIIQISKEVIVKWKQYLKHIR